jgi:hypothetical protein
VILLLTEYHQSGYIGLTKTNNPSVRHPMLKVKLVLFLFCLAAIAGSSIYFKGVNDGMAATDEEAFDAYVQVAKQMRPHHKARPVENAPTVWDVVDHPAKYQR